MSKYIKLYDAIMAMDEWFSEPITPTKILSDLPTIEVSEEMEFMVGQMAKDCFDKMSEDLYTEQDVRNAFNSGYSCGIESSEDCISREWLLSKVYDMDNDNLVVDLKDIENAPSVVPSRAEGEWRASTVHSGIVKCSVCGYQAGKYAESKEYKFCPNCGAKMRLE